MASRLTGTVIEWNDDRGFGFIRPDEGGADVFLHISAFNTHGRPEKGLIVTYAVENMANRNARAVNVRVPQTLSTAMEGLLLSLAPVLFFFAALGIYARFYGLPWYLPAGYGVMSEFTYLAYRADKAKAQAGMWRTPEKELHWMSVLCGWPGALVAQWHLRHKNRKLEFQLFFWATVVVNLAIVGYNFLPEWTEPLIVAFSESIRGSSSR